MPATASVTLTVTETAKTLTASAPLAVRESIPIAISPLALAAGACALTIIDKTDTTLAEATLTDGLGTLDLSTAEAVALFADLPAGYRTQVWAILWHTDEDRLLAKSLVTIINNPESARAATRIGAAGEVRLVLASNMTAGQPVMIDDDGKATPCLAANAHRFLGILRQAGSTSDTRPIVTAGIAALPSLTLVDGSTYYLARTAPAALTATPPEGYNVRPIGIAIGTAALAIIHHPIIQSLASGTHFLTWDTTTGRFLAVAPAAASLGAADADRIPCLDAAGLLDSSLIPTTATSTAALTALATAFAGLDALTDPPVTEMVTRLNAILSILKGS